MVQLSSSQRIVTWPSVAEQGFYHVLNCGLGRRTMGFAAMSEHRLTAERDAQADDLPPHVVRIPLPLPLKDLREVNVYAILGADGVTLVDSGWAASPVRRSSSKRSIATASHLRT